MIDTNLYQANEYPNKTTWTHYRIRIIDIAYVCLCIRGCLSWISINTQILTLILNILILSSINYKKLQPPYYIAFLFTLLIPFNVGALSIIDFLLMALLLKFSSVERLARIYIVVLFTFLLTWIYLYNMDILQSEDIYSMQKGYFKTYGFYNANGLGIFGFHIAVCSFILLRRYSTWGALLIAGVIVQVFYNLSMSRTVWLGGMLFCLCILLAKLRIINYRLKFIIAITPVLLTLLNLYLVMNYDSFWDIDVIISGRLSIPGEIMTRMSPIRWLIGFTIEKNQPLDGSIIMLLSTGGICAVILFCVWFYRMVAFRFKYVEPYLAVILGIFACGLSENTFAECTGLSVIFWYFLANNQTHNKSISKNS